MNTELTSDDIIDHYEDLKKYWYCVEGVLLIKNDSTIKEMMKRFIKTFGEPQ